MKSYSLVIQFVATIACVALLGCKPETTSGAGASETSTGKSESAIEQATEAVKHTVESAKEAGAKAVEQVRETSTQAVHTVTEKARELSAQGSARAQELIDSAKSYFNEGKYTNALARLKETTGETLSSYQKSTVDSLKAQIEKAMNAVSTAATNATHSASEAVNKLLQ